MRDGECRNRLALPLYGPRPSKGVCGQCQYRNGLRGLGDALAWILSWTPAKRLQQRQCGGCKARQQAMNEAVPFRQPQPCGKCQKPKAEAQAP
jgi:hypothetical protein